MCDVDHYILLSVFHSIIKACVSANIVLPTLAVQQVLLAVPLLHSCSMSFYLLTHSIRPSCHLAVIVLRVQDASDMCRSLSMPQVTCADHSDLWLHQGQALNPSRSPSYEVPSASQPRNQLDLSTGRTGRLCLISRYICDCVTSSSPILISCPCPFRLLVVIHACTCSKI
jgi:hypothetical protein